MPAPASFIVLVVVTFLIHAPAADGRIRSAKPADFSALHCHEDLGAFALSLWRALILSIKWRALMANPKRSHQQPASLLVPSDF
jgi:hypothetical protein